MLKSIYIQPEIIIDAAEYIGNSHLHKNKQEALYLLEDGQLIYKKTDLPKDQTPKEKIKNVIFQPTHGLLISMIAAALAPETVDLYSESFDTLSQDDIAKVQLMLLFSEIGFGTRHPYERAAKEFMHYCRSKQIYANEQQLEADASCLRSLDIALANKPKLMLMQHVKKDLSSALENPKREEGKYFNYIALMLQALGFHQSDDVAFDKRIFDFSQNPEMDLLFAYKALEAVPLEDFHMGDLSFADDSFFGDFNPAAEAFYSKQGAKK